MHCGASLCVIKKPCEQGGYSPRWAAQPEKINNNNDNFIDYASHMFLSSEKLALFTVLLKTLCCYWNGLYAATHA
jgi:hypothetical protein